MKENGLYHRLVDLQTVSANWKLRVQRTNEIEVC